VISADIAGNVLLTGCKDRCVRVWDVNHDGAPISRLPDHENKVTKVAHAGSCFYSTSRNVLRIWDSATSSCIEKIAFKGDGDIRDLVPSPTDAHVFYLATDQKIRLLDARNTKEPLKEITMKSKISCIRPLDFGMLAMGSMNNVNIFPTFSEADTASSQSLSPPHYNTVTCLTQCGPHLVSGSKDFSIKRWDCDPSTLQWQQGAGLKKAHDAHVTSLVGLRGGTAVIGGSAKGVLRIWDIATCSLKTEGLAHEGSITALVCENDTVYSASTDKTVKIWRYQPQLPAKSKAEEDLQVEQYGNEQDSMGSGEDNELVTSFMDDEDAANPLNQTITMAPSSASKMSAVETEDRRLTYALGNLNLDSVNRRETFCVPPRGAGGWVDDDAGSQGSGETSTTM